MITIPVDLTMIIPAAAPEADGIKLRLSKEKRGKRYALDLR